MDDIVKQAMAKWPNVPACSGWLGLDARGQWHLRDDEVQRIGPFAGTNPAGRGQRLEHEKLIAFIGRNYGNCEQGRWFFQNGPQRVFVSLATAPLTGRLMPDGRICTGIPADFQPRQAFLTPDGDCYLLAATVSWS